MSAIPEAAITDVSVAIEVVYRTSDLAGDALRRAQAHAAIEAAVPYIEARALEDAATEWDVRIEALSDEWLHMSLHEGKTLLTTLEANRQLCALLSNVRAAKARAAAADPRETKD